MTYPAPPTAVSLADRSAIDFTASFVLTSHDGSTEGFVVTKKAIKLSPFLAAALEDQDEAVITVKGLTMETVRNVAWYLDYFANVEEEPRILSLPKPFPDNHFSDGQLTGFEKHFADTVYPALGATDMRPLTGLLHGAQFVQCETLMQMTGCALTFHFRGKTTDEIKALMTGMEPALEEGAPPLAA